MNRKVSIKKKNQHVPLRQNVDILVSDDSVKMKPTDLLRLTEQEA
jgi:hypothetical protein